MIQIIGTSGTSEYRAAENFKRAFEDFLGESNVQRSDIRIVVSAKTYGEKRHDIDLIVAGKLATAVAIPRSSVVTLDALLLSFFLTVEVKDHPPNKLSFSGPKVFVKYKERREDASEQAEEQKYSAKNYIEKHGLDAPYIVSILLLNNCPNDHLPMSRHNILSGDFTAHELLEIIYMAYERRLTPTHKLIQAFSQRHASDYLGVVNLFTAKLEATQLDRKRIEVITRRNFNQKYATENLGKQLLVISGAGGTGKTVTLLQLAHFAYQERNAKALILTYNLALVSDIRRLMALMGMSEDIATSKVAISTVHSFIYKVLDSVGMNPGANHQFLHRYSALKAELLEVMGAINKSDVELWDYVFIDEGQDWPEDERDIVFGLYGLPNIVVAEGRAQLVRSQSVCDWTSWRMKDLHQALQSKGFAACGEVIRTIIKDAGFRWRAARVVLTSNDPEYRNKLEHVQDILSNLNDDERFFSVDEFGPFAIKMKAGRVLVGSGVQPTVPQWQKSKGWLIATAALELSTNQVTHFYSRAKNTSEMIRMAKMLIEKYTAVKKIDLSWDAASWHMSKELSLTAVMEPPMFGVLEPQTGE